MTLSSLLLGVAFAQDPVDPGGASQPSEVEPALIQVAAEADNSEGVGFPPDGPPITDDATLEARTYALSKGMRCPVCQGLSVADSGAEAAVAMKARTRELVGMGYSDGQIVDYFVGRYGTWVLLEPPAEGVNYLIFLAPLALIGLGGLAWWSSVKRGKDAAAPAAPAPKTADDDPYTRRVLDELER
jgi:cytochrome c-type biogenesis protein CcmH